MEEDIPTALKLKELRKKAGIGFREMARHLGLPPSSYGHYEDPNRFKDTLLPANLALMISMKIGDEELSNAALQLAVPEIEQTEQDLSSYVYAGQFAKAFRSVNEKSRQHTKFPSGTLEEALGEEELKKIVLEQWKETPPQDRELYLDWLESVFRRRISPSELDSDPKWQIARHGDRVSITATVDAKGIDALVQQLLAAKRELEESEDPNDNHSSTSRT